jgi:hypothetical protein
LFPQAIDLDPDYALASRIEDSWRSAARLCDSPPAILERLNGATPSNGQDDGRCHWMLG